MASFINVYHFYKKVLSIVGTLVTFSKPSFQGTDDPYAYDAKLREYYSNVYNIISKSDHYKNVVDPFFKSQEQIVKEKRNIIDLN